MQAYRFDRITRRLADAQFTRRGSLRLGGVGLAAAVVAAIGLPRMRVGRALAEDATPTAESTPDGAVNIEGTWLCNQPYALCTMAPCEPAPADENTSVCHCTVENGYSIGYTSCSERAPSGATLISTFSTQNVTSDVRAMVCTEKNRWANCLDMPCTIEADDPTRATCQCPVEESAEFFTEGGDCDVSTCASVIWSAASPSGNLIPVFETAMKQVNQQVTLPATCPSATPASTPASG